MSKTIERSKTQGKSVKRVKPSQVRPEKAFTLDQELEPFGNWVGKPIWVPPKDSSEALAETMLTKHGPLTSREMRWATVVSKHRSEFTQVREIDLHKASIRLPQGRFFVTLTERKDFGRITDTIPACVQTRLDEFLAGRGRRRGVKVYYLKPLCVEVDDELILTSQSDLETAIAKIQDEVFAAYKELYLYGLPRRIAAAFINVALMIPRGIVSVYVKKRQVALDAYHAKLEFRRRKTAHDAARAHRKCRSTGCSYEEMLTLTAPLETEEVVDQYAIENDLSAAQRARLLQLATGAMPWFVALSLGAIYIAGLTVTTTSPVMVCDPAFVAEFPDEPGLLWKIGHFDEIGGVTHVEI